MRANSMCISCLLSKQEKMIRPFADESKKSEYLHQLLKLLYDHGQTASAPELAEQINILYKEIWGLEEDFTEVKHQYNQLLLGKEAELETRVLSSDDPIRECIKYVCAANYIDFSAVANVNETTFEKLLEKAASETIDKKEYKLFKQDLKNANKLVYLTDNCGEIVLDKLFIKCLKETYPELQIDVIVRGFNTLNDATMEDAHEVGLTDIVPCVGNGNAAPGTVLKRLNEESLSLLNKADIIISKGQGNFESLYGENLNPYFLFLCKCELFVHRFGLEQYASVFKKEERINIK